MNTASSTKRWRLDRFSQYPTYPEKKVMPNSTGQYVASVVALASVVARFSNNKYLGWEGREKIKGISGWVCEDVIYEEFVIVMVI